MQTIEKEAIKYANRKPIKGDTVYGSYYLQDACYLYLRSLLSDFSSANKSIPKTSYSKLMSFVEKLIKVYIRLY